MHAPFHHPANHQVVCERCSSHCGDPARDQFEVTIPIMDRSPSSHFEDSTGHKIGLEAFLPDALDGTLLGHVNL